MLSGYYKNAKIWPSELWITSRMLLSTNCLIRTILNLQQHHSPCSGDPEGLLDRPGMGLQRPPMPAPPPPPRMQPLPPAPPPNAAALFSSCSISSRPALFWKRDIRLTTRGDMWVRAQGAPPYGLTGNTWVVPRRVLMATQRLSWLKHMSWTWTETLQIQR